MSQEWVQKQVDQFQFTFDQADKDKSGSLSFDEIYRVLQDEGFNTDKTETMRLFKGLDRDRSKSISREEFTAAIKKLPKLSIKEYCLRKMFKTLDTDGSGYLTKAEISDASGKVMGGVRIREERVASMLSTLTEDKDGKIDYEEFLRMFGFEESATVVHQMFTRLDTDKSGYLTKEELLDVIKVEAGEELPATFLDRITGLLNYLVGDSDKKISYEEFNKVWMKEAAKK